MKDNVPTPTEAAINGALEETERRVRCSCGFKSGWFDTGDANHISAHHDAECDGKVEYKEREKEWSNYSDNPFDLFHLRRLCPHCEDPRDYECRYCGRPFRRESSKNDHELICMGP